MKILKILFFVQVVLVAVAFYTLFNLQVSYKDDSTTIKRLRKDSVEQSIKNKHLQGLVLCDTIHKNCIRY